MCESDSQHNLFLVIVNAGDRIASYVSLPLHKDNLIADDVLPRLVLGFT
jgi:hypothetical protein